jgi:hypothetical protein
MEQHSALIASLILEVPIVVALGVALGRRAAPSDAPAASALLWLQAGVAATLLTHPFAWWLNEDALRGALTLWPRMLTIELLVTLAEGALFGWIGRAWARGLLLSALANATSFGLGLVWSFWLR